MGSRFYLSGKWLLGWVNWSRYRPRPWPGRWKTGRRSGLSTCTSGRRSRRMLWLPASSELSLCRTERLRWRSTIRWPGHWRSPSPRAHRWGRRALRKTTRVLLFKENLLSLCVVIGYCILLTFLVCEILIFTFWLFFLFLRHIEQEAKEGVTPFF